MSCSPFRKRCPQCLEMRVYTDKRKVSCSIPCDIQRRRESGFYRRFAAAGNASAKRRTQQNLVAMLEAVGASPEVVQIASKARVNSYAAGHMAGKDYGYRKGYAAAVGEQWAGGSYGRGHGKPRQTRQERVV